MQICYTIHVCKKMAGRDAAAFPAHGICLMRRKKDAEQPPCPDKNHLKGKRKMSRIGFDFGTTNSIISFHDEESGNLNCFKRAANDTEYIPTYVKYTIFKGNPITQIGRAAKLSGDGHPNVCARFKLRLGNRFDEIIPGKEKTAHEAAKDFIEKLLQEFRDSGHTIENMVMTIPEAWYREQSNYTTRENIRTILTEIGLRSNQFSFQSEPVAAAAYFCWKHEQVNQQPFTGKLLVIDYGGGTLDVTLCEITENGKKIRTLDNYGTGTEENGAETGHAGSAFIARTVKLLCEENGLTPSESEFSLACNELEDNLINQKGLIDEVMLDYASNPELVDPEPVFSLTRLNDCDVTSEHLYKAFQDVNAPVLADALSHISEVDTYDMHNTKIIFVGGFSNFCCVEHQIKTHFNIPLYADDPRLPNTLSGENKALAIAKGAALIANNSVTVDLVFPYEVGLVVGTTSLDNTKVFVDDYVPLIARHARIDRYREPQFLDRKFLVFAGTGLTVRMYRRIRADEEAQEFELNNRTDLQQLVPESQHTQLISLGISVDDNMIPTLYSKDETGIIRQASLNRILERLNFRIIN